MGESQAYFKRQAMPMTGRWTTTIDSLIAALQLDLPRSLKV
jgi:hypothetical protein